MVLTDAQAEERDQDRQWARDLAGKFGTPGQTPKPASNKTSLRTSETAEPDPVALEATLRRISCAAEFKYRKRHTWVYVIGCAVTQLISLESVLFFTGGRLASLNRESLSTWLIFGGLNVVLWFMMWRRAAPICPNCKQNIQTCPTEYCHVCGRQLNHKRCTDCGVDNSWIGWFRPNSNGSNRWITYCPGCGVHLDTYLSRWQPLGD